MAKKYHTITLTLAFSFFHADAVPCHPLLRPRRRRIQPVIAKLDAHNEPWFLPHAKMVAYKIGSFF